MSQEYKDKSTETNAIQKTTLNCTSDEILSFGHLFALPESKRSYSTPASPQNSKENIVKNKVQLDNITLIPYQEKENHIEYIQELMGKSLSEQYDIFIFRQFLDNNPSLCYLALDTENNKLCGAIVGEVQQDEESFIGYIAMLAVEPEYRKRGIGKALVENFILIAKAMNLDEIALETEVDNMGALKLYDSLGFTREKRHLVYYFNGKDAFALRLLLKVKNDVEDYQYCNQMYL